MNLTTTLYQNTRKKCKVENGTFHGIWMGVGGTKDLGGFRNRFPNRQVSEMIQIEPRKRNQLRLPQKGTRNNLPNSNEMDRQLADAVGGHTWLTYHPLIFNTNNGAES